MKITEKEAQVVAAFEGDKGRRMTKREMLACIGLNAGGFPAVGFVNRMVKKKLIVRTGFVLAPRTHSLAMVEAYGLA